MGNAPPRCADLPSSCPLARRPRADPVSDSALEQLRHVSTATLTTQLFKRGLRNVFIQNVKPLTPRDGEATVALSAFSVVVCNLIADVVYGLLDPRIRYR